jgi:hypothetical protein
VLPDAAANFAAEPILLPALPDGQAAVSVACGAGEERGGGLALLAVSAGGRVFELRGGSRFEPVAGLPADLRFLRAAAGDGFALAVDAGGGLHAWGAVGPALGVGEHFPHATAGAQTAPMRVLFAPADGAGPHCGGVGGCPDADVGRQQAARTPSLVAHFSEKSHAQATHHFSLVDLAQASARGFHVGPAAGDWGSGGLFVSTSGPMLLLSVPAGGESMLRWRFRVEGNSSWSVGVVPESAVGDMEFLFRRGIIGLDSEGLSGGVMRRQRMHGQWVSASYDTGRGVAEFVIGEGVGADERVEQRGALHGPVRLALSTFNDCRVTVVRDYVGAVTGAATAGGRQGETREQFLGKRVSRALPLRAGDTVRFAGDNLASARDHLSVCFGPLRPGDVGTVVREDSSSGKFLVRSESGTEWWYVPAVLVLAAPPAAACGGADVQGAEELLVAVADALLGAAGGGLASPVPDGGLPWLEETIRRFVRSDQCRFLAQHDPSRVILDYGSVPLSCIAPSRTVIEGLAALCRTETAAARAAIPGALPVLYRCVRVLSANLRSLLLPGRAMHSLDKGKCLQGHQLVGSSAPHAQACCNVCLQPGTLGSGAVGCRDCQWFSCKLCCDQAKENAVCYPRGRQSQASNQIRETIRSIFVLSEILFAYLDECEQKLQISGRLLEWDSLDFYDLRDCFADLLAAASKAASRIEGSGVEFFCPLLLALIDPASADESWFSNMWISALPRSLLPYLLSSFMESISTVESALELLFPDLCNFDLITDLSTLSAIMDSVIKFLNHHSRIGNSVICRLCDSVYTAFGSIQVALLLSLTSPDKFKDPAQVIEMVCGNWIVNFMTAFNCFLKDCDDKITSKIQSGDPYLFDEAQSSIVEIEQQLNASLFRVLVPAFVSGLQCCDWSEFSQEVLLQVYECQSRMAALVSKVPSWHTADQRLSAQIWQEPSEACIWFFSCAKLLQTLVCFKPFERPAISTEVSKWLDDGPFTSFSLFCAGSESSQLTRNSVLSISQGDEDFWLSAEGHVDAVSILSCMDGRRLVRQSTAAVLYLTTDSSNDVRTLSVKDIAHIYKVCAKAVAQCQWQARAEPGDWAGASERAAFLLDLAAEVVADSAVKVVLDRNQAGMSCGPLTHNDSGKDLLVRGLSETFRRGGSKGIADQMALNMDSILEFILDRGVSASVLKREIVLRNRRLHLCISVLNLVQKAVQEDYESKLGMLGAIFTAASAERHHYLNGFGGSDAALRKDYEAKLLGLLCASLNTLPTSSISAFAAICFGLFSLLATVKMNNNGLEVLLNGRVWSTLQQLQILAGCDEKLGNEEEAGSVLTRNLGDISLALICTYILETFQCSPTQIVDTSKLQSEIICSLLSWLESSSCRVHSFRPAVDTLSLCMIEMRIASSVKVSAKNGLSGPSAIISTLFNFLVQRCLGCSDQSSIRACFPSLTPRILGLLSKWAMFVGPAAFDAATKEHECNNEHLLLGDSPAGLRALFVLSALLVRTGLWDWDTQGLEYCRESPAARMHPADRILTSHAVSDFLGGLARHTAWQPAVISCCRHHLAPKREFSASRASDVSARGSRVIMALAMLGGNIPIVREGAAVWLPDPLDKAGHCLGAVVQFGFSQGQALVAIQDGELHWIAPTKLSPYAETSQNLALDESLDLLLPYIIWHTSRLLTESELKDIITSDGPVADAGVDFMSNYSQNQVFPVRYQGALTMHLLTMYTQRNAALTYQKLTGRGGQNLIDSLNVCVQLCPQEAIEDKDMRFNIHNLAEKAAALQHALFAWLMKSELPKDVPKGLHDLQRSDTLKDGPLWAATAGVCDAEDPTGIKIQRGLSGLGVPRQELWKTYACSETVGGSSDECLRSLSSVFRDLTLTFAINCAIEFLPEHLGSIHTESLAAEVNARNVMRLLHLAVCLDLPEERIRSVLARLLTSDRTGLPQYFVRVLLESSRPSRWLLQDAPAPLIRQTIHQTFGNRTSWSTTHSFGGEGPGFKARSAQVDKGMTTTVFNSGLKSEVMFVCSANDTEGKIVLEAEGATYAVAESSHTYSKNVHYKGSVQIEGAKGLSIDFDPRCCTGSGCDILQLSPHSEAMMNATTFSGSSGWNRLQVDGTDKIFYAFKSDCSCVDWGYRSAQAVFENQAQYSPVSGCCGVNSIGNFFSFFFFILCHPFCTIAEFTYCIQRLDSACNNLIFL